MITRSNRLNNFANGIGNYLRSEQQVFLLSDIPGNIGDHLIWAGTERLLQQQRVNFDLKSMSNLTDNPTNFRDSILVVPGSGALTHDWHEWLPKTVISCAGLFKAVVILPSEYEPAIEIVHNAVKLKNVWTFARDVESFVKIKPYGRATIAPDPALFAFDYKVFNPSFRSDKDLGEVLLALRTDKSSRLPHGNFQPVQSNNDISLTSKNLDQFLDQIQQHDTVVTDRLHVAVGSLMSGKTVRYLDPHNQKISRYAKFNFRSDFAGNYEQRNESWLFDRGFIERVKS